MNIAYFVWVCKRLEIVVFFADSVGPDRTFESKLRKRCENGPLALSSHSVRLRKRCEVGTCRNSLKTMVTQPKNSFGRGLRIENFLLAGHKCTV